MKKFISKVLIILIVFIIVFEFCCSSTVSAASSVINEKTLNAVTNLLGGIVSIIFWIPRILMTGMSFMINKLMNGIASTERYCWK